MSDISQGNDTADMHSDTVSIASSTEIDAQLASFPSSASSSHSSIFATPNTSSTEIDAQFASLPSSASSSHSSIFSTPNTSSDAMPAPLTERATPSSSGSEASTVMQQIANDVASETERRSISSAVNGAMNDILDTVGEQVIVTEDTSPRSANTSHNSMVEIPLADTPEVTASGTTNEQEDTAERNNTLPSGVIITRTGAPTQADNVGSQMMGMGAFNPDFSGTQPPATIITRTGQPTDIDELGSTMFGFGALDARNTVSQETSSPSERATGSENPDTSGIANVTVVGGVLNWVRGMGWM